MSAVACHYYDGRTSTRRDAELTITADGDLIVAIDGIDSRRFHSLADVRIPNRIANTPQHIRLPDGASCEVRDNDTLDAMQARAERGPQPLGRRFERFLHQIDSTWRGAAAALAVTAAILLSFTEWGAPAVATVVVAATPPEVEAVIGENLMTLLLQFDALEPTELDQKQQNNILSAFYKMKEDTGVEATHLGFFSAPRFGPNAFALPGAPSSSPTNWSNWPRTTRRSSRSSPTKWGTWPAATSCGASPRPPPCSSCGPPLPVMRRSPRCPFWRLSGCWRSVTRAPSNATPTSSPSTTCSEPASRRLASATSFSGSRQPTPEAALPTGWPAIPRLKIERATPKKPPNER